MPEDKKRSFKAVRAKPVGNGKYVLSSAHGSLAKSRFTIKPHKGQTPLDAAKKVLSRLCGLSNSSDCKERFALLETTRGAGHKLYFYKGKSVKLNKPRKIVFKKDSAGKMLAKPRVVNITHSHLATSLSSQELGHTNPLSDWKAKNSK